MKPILKVLIVASLIIMTTVAKAQIDNRTIVFGGGSLYDFNSELIQSTLLNPSIKLGYIPVRRVEIGVSYHPNILMTSERLASFNSSVRYYFGKSNVLVYPEVNWIIPIASSALDGDNKEYKVYRMGGGVLLKLGDLVGIDLGLCFQQSEVRIKNSTTKQVDESQMSNGLFFTSGIYLFFNVRKNEASK